MENIAISIICFIFGIGCFYVLKSSDKPKLEGINYIIPLALGTVAWLGLFTGGTTGLVGYINFVIIGVGMVIFHFIIKFFK
tara:strand:- start:41 stop:283 length:243 start_codon:yes stop_codon:yes gene_type:complete